MILLEFMKNIQLDISSLKSEKGLSLGTVPLLKDLVDLLKYLYFVLKKNFHP